MSFTRFLTWLLAVALVGGASILIARYAFDDPTWGTDAVWAVVGTTFFTRKVHESLLDMWSRPSRRALIADEED